MSDADQAAVVAAIGLADACGAVLGGSLVSVVLHGSLATDDFIPGVSDLDLLIVVDRGLTRSEADALIHTVREADLGTAAGVDVLVVTRRTALSPWNCPALELSVGRWPLHSADVAVVREDDHAADLWPELSEARAHGRALLGATPRVVIGEVPFAVVRDNGIGWLRTWLERIDDSENATHMVLTACRIWSFGVTGEHKSKSEAARWALAQDPSLLGVELALEARTSSRGLAVAPEDVARVLNRVLDDLDSSAPSTVRQNRPPRSSVASPSPGMVVPEG